MKTALLAAAAVLALTAGASAAGLPAATSAGKDVQAHRLNIQTKGLKTLYSQNTNNGGVGLVSQMFGSSYPTYDSQGADDFVVPTGKKWDITEVDVTGVYFNGAGPATSENVYFYADSSGAPGTLVKSFLNVAGTDNGTGSFAITLPKKGMKLKKAGTYWVSVQANLAYKAGGEWGWEDNSVQTGSEAHWQNPGNGFATGCTSWTDIETCLGYGPDLMFDLKGKTL